MLNMDYGKISNVIAARLILDDDDEDEIGKVSTVRLKRMDNRKSGKLNLQKSLYLILCA